MRVPEDVWRDNIEACRIIADTLDNDPHHAPSTQHPDPDVAAAVGRIGVVSAVMDPDGPSGWIADACGISPWVAQTLLDGRKGNVSDPEVYAEAAQVLRDAPVGASMRQVARDSGCSRKVLITVENALGPRRFKRQRLLDFVFERVDDGQPIATIAPPWAVTGCSLTGSAPPCATGQWLAGAVRVLAGGVPVASLAGTSTCVPTGTPMLAMSAQPRVVVT